jgi:hypothetical protein
VITVTRVDNWTITEIVRKGLSFAPLRRQSVFITEEAPFVGLPTARFTGSEIILGWTCRSQV